MSNKTSERDLVQEQLINRTNGIYELPWGQFPGHFISFSATGGDSVIVRSLTGSDMTYIPVGYEDIDSLVAALLKARDMREAPVGEESQLKPNMALLTELLKEIDNG